MNFIKSIFSKPPVVPQQQKPKNQNSDFSILDPQFTQVRLRDAKILIKDMKKLEQVLNYQPESINEQLKKCYALHIILSSDQYQVIDKVVAYCEKNHVQCLQYMSFPYRIYKINILMLIIKIKINFLFFQSQSLMYFIYYYKIVFFKQNTLLSNYNKIIFISKKIKPITQNTQTRTAATTNINQTCQIMSDQQMIATQFQNSMYLNVSDQLQFYEQIHQNESEFMNIYFNYIQRITQNSDIYNSCKFHQYPYEDETFNRKLQFVWLFKIINMLNYKLAFIPFLQFLFNCKTQNSFIIRDIAYLIYKDCLMEYGFLRNEITDMVDSYSQFQVRESLQFYELVVFMLEINKKMKLFYDMRQQFALNSSSVRDIKWFVIDKKQLIEIENFISKAKLLNTAQFKKSLMVPTQKILMENLQKLMLDPSLMENSFMKEPTTAKNIKKFNELLYSPLNSKQIRISNHSRQLSKN